MGLNVNTLVYESNELPCFLVSDVLVCVALRSGPPSEPAWAGFLDVSQQRMDMLGGVVIVAGNATFSPKQRERLRKVYGTRNVRISVLTDSPEARGALTALSWFGMPICGFAQGDYREALDWLGRAHLTEVVDWRARQTVSPPPRRSGVVTSRVNAVSREVALERKAQLARR
jgi:hypothetical protein